MILRSENRSLLFIDDKHRKDAFLASNSCHLSLSPPLSHTYQLLSHTYQLLSHIDIISLSSVIVNKSWLRVVVASYCKMITTLFSDTFYDRL